MQFSIKVTVFVVCCAVSDVMAVEVTTKNGVIYGSDHLRSRQGNVVYSFTGIPYAQPPVGKLRFKDALPVEPWKTPINATSKCPICVQPDILWSPGVKIIGQEDCLSLNVYSPSLNPGAKLPVLFYIHGGAYKILYPMAEPEFLVGDIVLVDITYRLGALGFATTGDGVITGNLGLKDQLLALKWVHENIEHFGGDPNSVTVFGQSAGGASTHLLLLSPLSKGLLHRGISMSGTGECPWATVPRQVVVDRTKALAVLCGCPPEPSTELLQCLQTISARDIIEMQKKFHDIYGLPMTAFAPVVEEATAEEKALVPTDPSKVEWEIPWMTGIVPSETIGFPTRFLAAMERNGLNNEEEFDSILFKWLSQGFHIPREEIPPVVNRIKEFYFGDVGPIKNETLPKFDDIITDGWFLTGLMDAVSHHKGNTYVYFYDYLQSNATFSNIFGSGLDKGTKISHMDELLSIFPLSMYFPTRTMSEMDIQVSEKMVALWTNFAKYGNFTINSATNWEPVERPALKYKYLHISAAGFTQKEDLLAERADFWRSLRNGT